MADNHIRVHVTDNFPGDGVNISLMLKYEPGSDHVIVRFDDQEHPGQPVMHAVPALTATEPSMILPHDFARALLDALLRHYQGASDMHTVRSDLLHERGRVDELLKVLSMIAVGKQDG